MSTVRKSGRTPKPSARAQGEDFAPTIPTATANGFTIAASQPQKIVSKGRKRNTKKLGQSYTPKNKQVDVGTKAQPKKGVKRRRKEENLVIEDSEGANGITKTPSDHHDSDEEYEPIDPDTHIHPTEHQSEAPTAATTTATQAFLDSLHPDIHAISTQLHACTLSGQTQMELPELSLPYFDPTTGTQTHGTTPWKSAQLFHLYILSYSKGHHQICDLVVDTWIREFHKLDDVKSLRIWRKNIHRYVDERAGPEDLISDNGDANVDIHATDFEADRLNELFRYTEVGCGARNLWVDAMALVGEPLEDVLERQGGREKWGVEVVWDLLATSLRLSRAHRTLKVEERWPAAWCNRYHEHGERTCYRVAAREEIEREGGKDGEGPGEENGVEVDGEGIVDEEWTGERRVSFGNVDVIEEGSRAV